MPRRSGKLVKDTGTVKGLPASEAVGRQATLMVAELEKKKKDQDAGTLKPGTGLPPAAP